VKTSLILKQQPHIFEVVPFNLFPITKQSYNKGFGLKLVIIPIVLIARLINIDGIKLKRSISQLGFKILFYGFSRKLLDFLTAYSTPCGV
jgi:hypothetical protein